MEDKTQILYKTLTDQGLYTKTFDDFTTQFSDPAKRQLLHKTLNEKGLYTKTYEDFDNQFFPVKKKDFSEASLSGETSVLPLTEPLPQPQPSPFQQKLKSLDVIPKEELPQAVNDLARSHKEDNSTVMSGILDNDKKFDGTLRGYLKLRNVTPKMLGLPEGQNLDRDLREGDIANYDDLLAFKGLYQKPQAPNLFWGTVKRYNLGTAQFFRSLDNATKSLSNMTGIKRGGFFGDIADYIEWHESNLPDNPDTFTGNVLGGAASMSSLFLELAVTPQFKFKAVGKILKVPKLITQMVGSTAVNRYAEAIPEDNAVEVKTMVEGIKGAGAGAIQGSLFTVLGYGSGALGEMVGKTTKSAATGLVTSVGANAAGFAGYDAVQQLLEKGNIDWDQTTQQGAMGAVLGFPAMAKWAGTRAWGNLMTASKDAMSLAQKLKYSPEDGRKKAFDIRQKAMEEQDMEKRASMESTANALDALIDIKTLGDEVIQDPSKFIKIINSDPDLTVAEKQLYTNRINEIVSDRMRSPSVALLENELTSLREELSNQEVNTSISDAMREINTKSIKEKIRNHEKTLINLINKRTGKTEIQQSIADLNDIEFVGQQKDEDGKPALDMYNVVVDGKPNTFTVKTAEGKTFEEQNEAVVKKIEKYKPKKEEEVKNAKSDGTENQPITEKSTSELEQGKGDVNNVRNDEQKGTSEQQKQEEVKPTYLADEKELPKNVKDRTGEEFGTKPSVEQEQKINETKELYKTLPDGTKIFYVDADVVRDVDKFGDFVEGGNEMAYPNFVPRGEVWIDNAFKGNEKRTNEIMVHEAIERKEMQDNPKREYFKDTAKTRLNPEGEEGAHVDANKIEKQVRDGEITPDDAIKKYYGESPIQEITPTSPSNPPEIGTISSETSNAPPEKIAPPTETTEGGVGETKFRQTQTNALIQDQTLQQKAVAEIVDTNKERYTVLHGEKAIISAKKMIDEQGVANATIDLAERTKHLDDFPTRQVGRMVLLDFYSRAITDRNATESDKTMAFKNLDRLQQIMAREATKAGQGNAMLAIWKSMQPSGLLEFVGRKIADSNNKALAKKLGDSTVGQQLDELYKTLSDESKKIIGDIIAGREIKIEKEGEIPVRTTPKPRSTALRERITREQTYRKSIIEQYKKTQEGVASASLVGLTSAQIELGGNLLGSYVREANYRVQEVIDKLISDFKEAGIDLSKEQADGLLKQKKDEKETFEDYIGRKESVSDKRAAEKLISKKINDVLREHWTEKDELKRTLAQKLIEELGLSESDAKKIEKETLDSFDKEIVKRSQSLMTKLIGTSKIPVEKAQKGLMQKMIELVNMGALDEGLYRDLFAEKFNLTKLTDQHKMEILKLADNVQQASGHGWLERDATIKLAKYIYELYPKGKANEILETWTSLTYANMLMGLSTTALNIWSQGSNMTLKPVRDLVNLSRWLHIIKNGKKGEGTDAYNPFGEMFYVPMIEGRKMGWNEAKEVYLNGDLNNKYVEDVAKKGQFRVTPLERNKYGKSKRFKPWNVKIGNATIDMNLGNAYKYAGRNLAAQDKLMLTTSYDTEVVRILRDKLRTSDLTGRALTKAVMDIYRGEHIDQKELDAQLESDVQLHKKLTGEDMSEIQKKIRKRELVLDKLPLTKEEKEEAEKLARSSIFTDERSGLFGTLAHGLNIAVNSSPVAGVIFKPFIPFTTIVGNVAESMVDYTPFYGFMRANGLGFSAMKKLINPEWGTSQMGEKGSRAYYEQMGRAWFGTLAFGAALAFFLDKKEDSFLEISGGYSAEGFKKPGRANVMPQYTLRIGSVKIPYMNIPALAIPLAIIGNINDGLRAGVDEGDLRDRLTLSLLFDASMQSITMVKDMSFVDGVQGLATMIGDAASTDGKKLGKIGTDMAKTYLGFALRPLPQNNNAVQQIWKIFDPTSYLQSDIKSILAYSAGLQHFVNKPNLDQLGDVVKTYPGETLLPYTHWLNIKGKDERWKFLAEHNAIPGKGANRVFQIETKDGIEKRKLDEDELYDYTDRAGELFSNYLMGYKANADKVAKRGAEIIEREKTTGEIEKITGIQEDMEKAWAKAKDDAETELFKWGSIKEDMPNEWELIKKNKAYHPYQASKTTGDYKWDKSELYLFNNLVTLRYAEKIKGYLSGSKAQTDKTQPSHQKKEITKFEDHLNTVWDDAQTYVSNRMDKQIRAKIKEAEKPTVKK